METISIGIQNLLAPCNCACKYCLLRSCGQAEGVSYERGKRIADAFVRWGKRRGLKNLPYYYIGYCAEYPELLDTIAFNRQNGFCGAGFLQCNGIRIRSQSETDAFVEDLKKAGITMIDISFYGTEAYHDRFAARAGDYRFMMQLAQSAEARRITCAPSVAITEENKGMLGALFDALEKRGDVRNIHTFLPDYRGRGDLVEDVRLTKSSYEALPDRIKKTINISRHRTQREWLLMDRLPEYTKRALVITLRRDNIDMLEAMRCDEMVAYVEALDDAYYRALPSINELAELYGDRESEKLYRLRDLFWMWQRRYRREHRLHLYDVTDERFCAAVRS